MSKRTKPTDREEIPGRRRRVQPAFRSAPCRMGARGSMLWSIRGCGSTGIEGLRVADASIMPQVPRRQTPTRPSIMIGEKMCRHDAGGCPGSLRATCRIAVCALCWVKINQNQRRRRPVALAGTDPTGSPQKILRCLTIPGSGAGGRGEHYRGNTRDPTLRHSRGATERSRWPIPTMIIVVAMRSA